MYSRKPLKFKRVDGLLREVKKCDSIYDFTSVELNGGMKGQMLDVPHYELPWFIGIQSVLHESRSLKRCLCEIVENFF